MQIVCAKNDCYSELHIKEVLWSPIAPGQLLCVWEATEIVSLAEQLLSEKARSVRQPGVNSSDFTFYCTMDTRTHNNLHLQSLC